MREHEGDQPSEAEMKEQYNKHFMQSLGAETMEEAMMIASAAGIQPEDIP